MQINDKLVNQIVDAVVQRLSENEVPDNLQVDRTSQQNADAPGVFQNMDDCIPAAVAAQKKLLNLPLDTRRQVIQAIRDTGKINAAEYGRMEFEETELGKHDDNVAKNRSSCEVLGMEDLVPEVYAGDKGVTIIERIPVGVIASVHPVTNAAPSILFNAIMMISGGNAVVVNPHPKTKQVSSRVIRDLNKAIVAAGGPANCLCCLAEPSVPSAQQLMTHPAIGMIAVTGGHGVVDFATKTGKRVIAGGPGNPPVVVDETADLDRAAQCIIQGAGFSNCIACASEKEIFVVESVADRLKEKLKKGGAYEISASQGQELVKHIFKEVKKSGHPSVINMDYIGKTPQFILKSIGLEVGPEVQIVILETDQNHPLVWTEQIMPVLPMVRCRNVDQAIEWALAAEQNFGHTMAIHSSNLSNIRKMAAKASCASFVKNGACGLGGVGITGEGYVSFHIATNGEGHTRPRTFTRIRRCVMADDLRYRYGSD
ncbi:Acetaldehyde dehydrogenase (EC @ Acetaldehyde dehydrogenase (EC, ethanolamine utilization cluster [Olavius sp. associated proteobacterium Delta 1]|nr:Acetaldehyde dehydrogenase (EC @ Acetaldehyde dehydrogenase (EC, ethanolamine utilization cluster [Olavius sp. associated proteobacterium Delta 1]